MPRVRTELNRLQMETLPLTAAMVRLPMVLPVQKKDRNPSIDVTAVTVVVIADSVVVAVVMVAVTAANALVMVPVRVLIVLAGSSSSDDDYRLSLPCG
jgi:hypothetical protein